MLASALMAFRISLKIIVPGILLAACQPTKIPSDEDDGDTGSSTDTTNPTDGFSDDGGSDTSASASNSNSDPSESQGESGSDPTATTAPPDPSGGDDCGDGEGLEFKPAGALEPLVDTFPTAIDPFSGEFGGRLQVFAGRPTGVTGWGFIAWADFYDIAEPGTSVTCGVELDPLADIDDCGVRYYGGFGWGGGSFDARSAGAATLVGPGVSAAMEMAEPPNKGYSVSLDEQGIDPMFGADYGFEWTGDEVEAGQLPALVSLPPELEVLAPAGSGWTIVPGPLALEWTGGGVVPTLAFELIVTPDPSGGSEWFELTCELADDGSFEIPADVIAHLPPGWSGTAALVRHNIELADVAGRSILGAGTVAVDVPVAIAE